MGRWVGGRAQGSSGQRGHGHGGLVAPQGRGQGKQQGQDRAMWTLSVRRLCTSGRYVPVGPNRRPSTYVQMYPSSYVPDGQGAEKERGEAVVGTGYYVRERETHTQERGGGRIPCGRLCALPCHVHGPVLAAQSSGSWMMRDESSRPMCMSSMERQGCNSFRTRTCSQADT